MENAPLYDGGKSPDQPLKNPLRVADNSNQIISTKSLLASTDNLLEVTVPNAGDCSSVEEVAANQSTGHNIARAENSDHMQNSKVNLTSVEATRNDVAVVQNDTSEVK